jgi:hypothetical protein
MQKIKDTLKSIALWIWRSSADPKKVSLTIRAGLLGAATWAVFAGGALNLPDLAANWNELAGAIAEFVEKALFAVSAFGVAFGAARKLILTLQRAFGK